MMSDALRNDADILESSISKVSDAVFRRIDGCFNAYNGGGEKPGLTAAARFMLHLDQGAALEARAALNHSGGPKAFDAAITAQQAFTREYPEFASAITPADWEAAVLALRALGKRGKAAPWTRLARIFSKTGFKIDGENLKKTCEGVRNTPGRELGKMRWGNRKR